VKKLRAQKWQSEGEKPALKSENEGGKA